MGYILKVRDDNGNVIGIPAIQGENGKDGKDGIDGKDGVNGKDGTNGKDGIDGKNGIDGKDGSTPFIGNNGNWWIGGADTGVTARTSLVTGTATVVWAETSEMNYEWHFSIALDFTPKIIVGVINKDHNDDKYATGCLLWINGRFNVWNEYGFAYGDAPFVGGEVDITWGDSYTISGGEWHFTAIG